MRRLALAVGAVLSFAAFAGGAPQDGQLTPTQQHKVRPSRKKAPPAKPPGTAVPSPIDPAIGAPGAPNTTSPQGVVPAVTTPEASPAGPAEPPESIEADVSTHAIAVTSVFQGTDIVVFGTVLKSRQESAEAGYYDVVVLVEGRAVPTVVRLKERVGPIWMNNRSIRFDGLPIYSVIASTRPIDEIADPPDLVANGIGFPRARMMPGAGSLGMSATTIDEFKTAFQDLKQKDGLYLRAEYGVVFIGRSLFRASLKLPANIPVGPLTARAFLFHDGQLLAIHTASVVLTRSGMERLVYDFAYDHPVLYGLLAVALTAGAGLAATTIFRRPGG